MHSNLAYSYTLRFLLVLGNPITEVRGHPQPAEKMEQLTALGQAKAAKRAARKAARTAMIAPQDFERIGEADVIRARGMSIRIDRA
jgi:hypothetical protein